MTDSAVTIGAVGTLIVTIIGALTALLKVPKDNQKTASSVAGDAVVVQHSVIETLYSELERLQRNHEECEKNRASDRLSFEIRVARLQSENEEARKNFETQVAELRELVSKIDERQRSRRDVDLPPEASRP